MNTQKQLTGAKTPLNKASWIIGALQSIGINLTGLSKRDILNLAARKLDRSKHAGGRMHSNTKNHPAGHKPGRSGKHLRFMGRGERKW